MADQQADAAQFAEVVKGLSDEDLTQQIENLGTDEVLKAIFEGMEQALVSERAAGVNATVQYDIDTPAGAKSWTATIANGSCTTSEGPADNPRLTLGLGILDFIRLIFGQADGTQLFMSGKMKLQGDMMFAMQLQNLFDRPA